MKHIFQYNFLFFHYYQGDSTGRRAAEVIDELTDFGALRNITGDTESPPQVRDHFKTSYKRHSHHRKRRQRKSSFLRSTK